MDYGKEMWKLAEKYLDERYSEGFKAGQESMRERAVAVCDKYGEPSLGGAILALLIEEPPAS